MRVGVPKESEPGERRVALVPDAVAKLVAAGFEIAVERGAGADALFPDEAYADAARPTADLVLPTLNEHAIGQLLQMLMLATVVEGRMMGTNPYGQPGVEAYKQNMTRILKNTPNLPRGEMRDAAKGM